MADEKIKVDALSMPYISSINEPIENRFTTTRELHER